MWKIKTPLKVTMKHRVPTRDNLSKKGWSREVCCVLCMEEHETVDHLFFASCCFSRALLECFLPNKQFLHIYTCSSTGALRNASNVKWALLGRRELPTIVTLWCALWLERNKKNFDNRKLTLRQLSVDLRSTRNL